MRRFLQIAAVGAGLALAGPALADGPQQAVAPPAAAPPRIRASHRVDVIAPGEKVETVIERLRASRTNNALRGTDGRGVERAGERGGPDGAEGRRDGDHGGGDGPRTGPGSTMPGTGPPPVQGERPHR